MCKKVWRESNPSNILTKCNIDHNVQHDVEALKIEIVWLKILPKHISQPFIFIFERSTRADKSMGVCDVSRNLSPHTLPASPAQL